MAERGSGGGCFSLWELCEGKLKEELPCWVPWRIGTKGFGDRCLFPWALLGKLEGGSSTGDLRDG